MKPLSLFAGSILCAVLLFCAMPLCAAQPPTPPTSPLTIEKIYDFENETSNGKQAENSRNGVYPGELVYIRFTSDKLTGVMLENANAKSGEVTETPLEQDMGDLHVWKVRIPNDSLPADSTAGSPRAFTLIASSPGLPADPKSKRVTLKLSLPLYPAPAAKITKIVQKSYDQNTNSENLILQGQGLLAPLECIHLHIGSNEAKVTAVSPEGDRLYAEFTPDDTPYRLEPLTLKLWNSIAESQDAALGMIQTAKPVQQAGFLMIAGGIFVLVGAFVLVLSAKPRWRLPGFLGNLLLEKQNNTYSLSYFQFYWWSSIIVFGWLFIFIARGFASENWQFPSLSGFAYTFLISLGTLIGAQSANTAKGPKGSGVVHPSLSDLIYNGGVLAPERVQHLIWTLLSGAVYLVIIITSAFTITSLPVIPNELVVLMGLSSAGYVGGKLARKPGPVINQAITRSARSFTLSGLHLSTNARIKLQAQGAANMADVPQDGIKVLKSDPERPEEFASTLLVTLPATLPWFVQGQANQWHIVLINADGQESEQDTVATTPPPLPIINQVAIGAANPQGQAEITIMAGNMENGAGALVRNLNIPLHWQQDPANPNRFTVQTARAVNWLQQPQTFVVTNPDGDFAEQTIQLIPAPLPAPALTAVTPAPVNAQGQVLVTVTGTNIAPGAALTIANVNPAPAWQQDPADSNRFTITVPQNTAWLTPPQTYTIANPDGQISDFNQT